MKGWKGGGKGKGGRVEQNLFRILANVGRGGSKILDGVSEKMLISMVAEFDMDYHKISYAMNSRNHIEIMYI